MIINAHAIRIGMACLLASQAAFASQKAVELNSVRLQNLFDASKKVPGLAAPVMANAAILKPDLPDRLITNPKPSSALTAGKTSRSSGGFMGKALVSLLNLTWGLPNTLIALGIGLVAAILSPFFESIDFPSFRASETGKFLMMDVGPGLGGSHGQFAMGLFEVGNPQVDSEHVAGHHVQSAVLGPFYIPAILISYLFAGGHGGYFEDSATSWSELADW